MCICDQLVWSSSSQHLWIILLEKGKPRNTRLLPCYLGKELIAGIIVGKASDIAKSQHSWRDSSYQPGIQPESLASNLSHARKIAGFGGQFLEMVLNRHPEINGNLLAGKTCLYEHWYHIPGSNPGVRVWLVVVGGAQGQAAARAVVDQVVELVDPLYFTMVDAVPRWA